MREGTAPSCPVGATESTAASPAMNRWATFGCPYGAEGPMCLIRHDIALRVLDVRCGADAGGGHESHLSRRRWLYRIRGRTRAIGRGAFRGGADAQRAPRARCGRWSRGADRVERGGAG